MKEIFTCTCTLLHYDVRQKKSLMMTESPINLKSTKDCKDVRRKRKII
jgi:hypothetical protein